MIDAQFPYEITSWPMESLVDSRMEQRDELSPHPFIAGDFPLPIQEGLDSSWTAEQFNWIEETPVKLTTFQPYPQIWYDAGLVRENCGGKRTNTTSFSLHQSTPFQTTENPPIHPLPDLQLATQRALFMTPIPNTLAVPFPGSPSSNPNGSPEPSQASSSGWEGEAEPEDAQYMQLDFGPSDFGASAFDTQHQTHGQTHRLSSPHRRHSRIDEECLTPLEMPDGSTRMTSNWLPVDPDAGFAIGPSMMMNEDVAFKDMKYAFIPLVPEAWPYDR
ncbi:hypothetical protein PDIG_28290 [Penicillium digitatum PHI26]|uniref:Uncharacterized protein n=2 Tax=Penicillium digitatum TaxID=36651 RepID=K9GK99_PEND2|nr:hypothetical protein PDIP_62730 [Penicillium digitatum Pd1]EKV09941.1 hypothetical protein PDIP_62730 [Penicillium digitatum Pd1]EKV15148.1 hypothetical protein PDIG_28290 [Penicillium digitatum PHI26]